MRLRFFLALLLIAVPRVFGQALPDLGGRIAGYLYAVAGAAPGRKHHAGDSGGSNSYDEPEATDYLTRLGNRLARAAPMRARNSISS